LFGDSARSFAHGAGLFGAFHRGREGFGGGHWDRHGFFGFDRDHDRGFFRGFGFCGSYCPFGFGYPYCGYGYPYSSFFPYYSYYPFFGDYGYYDYPYYGYYPGYSYPYSSPTYYDTTIIEPGYGAGVIEGYGGNAGETSMETARAYNEPTTQPAAGNQTSTMPATRLQKQMMDGVDQFTSGKYDDAAKTFFKAMTADPKNVDATLAYAVARFATGDYAATAAAIRRGIRQFPGVVNSTFDIRDRYGKPEDFDRHLKALEDFTHEKPDNVDAWIVLGFVRHFTGDRDLANRTFGLVKRLSSSDAGLVNIFLKAKPLNELQPSKDAGPSKRRDSGPGGGQTGGNEAGDSLRVR
jgi:tetratricopeptide (TPR) repeat protein